MTPEGSLSAIAAFFPICGIFFQFAAFFPISRPFFQFQRLFFQIVGIFSNFCFKIGKKPQIGKKAASSKQKGSSQDLKGTQDLSGPQVLDLTVSGPFKTFQVSPTYVF